MTMTTTAPRTAPPPLRRGRPVRVLSLDGGGVRGLIAARVLERIELRTGRPIADAVDLVAGTSTGAILALGLTRAGADGRPAHSAADLAALYREDGSTIFDRSPLRWLATLGSLVDERYTDAGLERVLAERFGDSTLSAALAPVLVPCYDIERRRPHLFRSWRAGLDEPDHAIAAVARAASAAPTYFEPARLPAGDRSLALIDGGVFANNPAMYAYTHARELFPDSPDVVVSLGCGRHTRSIPLDDARDWGLAHWARPILDVVFDGVSDAVDEQLRALCHRDDGVRRYYRFEVELDAGHDGLDDTSPANLHALERRAAELLDTHEEALDQVCAWLTGAADDDG
jgi:hypothetical protein